MDIFIRKRTSLRNIKENYNKIKKYVVSDIVQYEDDDPDTLNNAIKSYVQKYYNPDTHLSVDSHDFACVATKRERFSYMLCGYFVGDMIIQTLTDSVFLIYDCMVGVWKYKGIDEVYSLFRLAQDYLHEVLDHKYKPVTFERSKLRFLMTYTYKMSDIYCKTIEPYRVNPHTPIRFNLFAIPFSVREVDDANVEMAETYVRELFGTCDYSYWCFRIILYVLLTNKISKSEPKIMMFNTPKQIIWLLRYLVGFSNSAIVHTKSLSTGMPEMVFNSVNHRAQFVINKKKCLYPNYSINKYLLLIDGTNMQHFVINMTRVGESFAQTLYLLKGDRPVTLYKNKMYMFSLKHIESLIYDSAYWGNSKYWLFNQLFLLKFNDVSINISTDLAASLCKWALSFDINEVSFNKVDPAITNVYKKYNVEISVAKLKEWYATIHVPITQPMEHDDIVDGVIDI